jgi:uncharacterized protein involved in propanediol utilization
MACLNRQFPVLIARHPLMERAAMWSTRKSAAVIAICGFLLAGCVDVFTPLVLFPHSQFVTVADVDLRSGQDDESSIVAHVPKGTIVTPIGQMGSEANAAWRINTPEGIGWVYTRYLASLPLPPEE